MKKTILNFGLISGAIGAVLMLASALYYKSNPDFKGGELYGYLGIFLSMIFVYLGVKSYRDKESGGAISFGKAFQIGIFISIISCLIYVLTWMFVYATIMPDFMEKYITHTLEQLQASGASAETIAAESQKMDEFKTMYQNPLVRFGLTFLEPFPVGFLVSLISAIVLRKNAA
ncbi:MAG: DUF4199 domain-containing protein [Saprospiraceae bacterium]|nr:DUF4199 domain-containing protein [Saprospiraceae bacterium]